MSAARIWGAHLAALALLLLAPRLIDDFHLLLLSEMLIVGLFAASLDLLVGYGGMTSLGHAAFFGAGGYAAALTARELTPNGPAGIAAGVVLAAAVAGVTGLPAVRAHGLYFLMLTLAFSQLLLGVALTWPEVTGGSNGLSGIPIPRLLPTVVLRDDRDFYHYVLGMVALGYAVLRVATATAFGRALDGIRENEPRMRSLGHPVYPLKLAAYVIAGAVAGGAGALFVQHERFASPTNLGFHTSALVLIAVVLGGRRCLWGAALGAGLVLLLRDELSSRLHERWELALGAIFVAAVYLFPRGLAGLLPRRWPRPAARPNADDERPPTPATAPEHPRRTDAPPLLELSNVSRHFGAIRAVDGLSLQIRPGERRALIGPNGAGKSTVLDLIAGRTRLSGGTIRLRGEDIARLPEFRRARRGIASTFQRSSVFDGLTVQANLLLALERPTGRPSLPWLPALAHTRARQRASDLLALVDLATRREQPARQLSYGERRRLDIALALAARPDLLLLDEPTAGMSRGESDGLVALLARLPRSVAVVIVEHNLEVAFAVAEQVTVLHLGRVLAEGVPAAVRALPEVQRAYLGGEAGDELFIAAAAG